MTFADVYFTDRTHGWAVGAGGTTILHTTDAGKSWHIQLDGGGEGTALNAVFFIDENVGWAVGGLVLKTTNGGETWIDITDQFPVYYSFSSIPAEDVFFVNEQHGWIVKDGGEIFHTTDGGQSWQQQSVGKNKWLTSVYFKDEQHGFITGNWGTILETTDGGEHWFGKFDENYDWFNSITFVNDTLGFVVGRHQDNNNGAILQTADGGHTWTYLEDITSTHLFSVSSQGDRCWAAGEYGTILRRDLGDDANSIPFDSTKEQNISIFPNPSRYSIVIDFYLDAGQNVKVELFNILGEKVGTKSYTAFSKGLQSTSIDISSLTPGIYICRISGKNYNRIRKFIKL
jgi:photosystem II stability/assembly factor-like uncharacterized protein